MTRDTPEVSIVVVARDVRDDVLRCFESIARHASPVEVETFLVDNASSDGTAEAVARDFPDTEIIRLTRNEGVVARNHGMRAARGRLLMWLDSDARLTPGALETLVRFVDDHPEAGVVGPRLEYPDGSLQLSTRRFPPLLLPFLRRPPLARFFDNGRKVRRHLMTDDSHDHAREVEYVLGACQLFRAEAKAAAGEVDEWMFYGHDDADWCFRIRSAGFKVLYCPQARVIHDYRRTSARRPLSSFALRFFWIYWRFQWKWRRDRRRLIREGAMMDARARA